MKIRSLEEIQAQKRKEEDEKQKSKLVAQPELVPNINIRKVIIMLISAQINSNQDSSLFFLKLQMTAFDSFDSSFII